MTETSKSRGVTAMPHTFSLLPDLTIHNLYNGYWYVGRPTLDEFRADLRAMMRKVAGFRRAGRAGKFKVQGFGFDSGTLNPEL